MLDIGYRYRIRVGYDTDRNKNEEEIRFDFDTRYIEASVQRQQRDKHRDAKGDEGQKMFDAISYGFF